jgi:hypothetical protein
MHKKYEDSNNQGLYITADKGGYFQKLYEGFETSHMTSDGLGEMFEGKSADLCAEKFTLKFMGGQQRFQHAQTQEQGHPSAWAQFLYPFINFGNLEVSNRVWYFGSNFNNWANNYLLGNHSWQIDFILDWGKPLKNKNKV